MRSNLWVVDSGANSHFSVVREDFITLSPSDSGTFLGISVCVRGHGSCKLTLVDSACRRCTFTLNEVLYVPDFALRSNGNYLRLLSVQVATNRGCRFEFTLSGARLCKHEGSAFEMMKSKGLVWLPSIQPSMVTVPKALLSKYTDYDTIHKRCCHVSDATIRKLSSLGIKGIPAHCTPNSRTFYISYVVARSNVANINRTFTRTDDPDTCLHTLAIDIWGTVNTPSIRNFSYVFGVVC
jgi:hypothetical protein